MTEQTTATPEPATEEIVAEELRSKLRGNIATTSTNAPITTAYH